MLLKEIQDQQTINTFVANAEHGNFLQSYEWGEFQKSLGRDIWRVGVYADEKLLSLATIVAHPLPLGLSYLYVPYGPVFAAHMSFGQKQDATKILLTKLRSITQATKQHKEIFARIEPRIFWEEAGNFFVNLGMKKTSAVQPQDTDVIDLTESEAWLLKQMHPKTRYNIRLAEKKGVTFRLAQSSEEVDIFFDLLKQTTERDSFYAHEKSYYEKLFTQFGKTDEYDQMHFTIELLFAEYEGKVISALMLGLFGNRALYLHGASDHAYRKVMAPQYLQWQAMLLAKQAGYTFYDLWGVKPANRHLDSQDKEHAWEGITRFKKGFGGKEINYAGAWDFVYDSSLYQLYKIVRKLRS